MKKRGNDYKSQDLNGNPGVGTTARLEKRGNDYKSQDLNGNPGVGTTAIFEKRGNDYKSQDLSGNPGVGTTARLKSFRLHKNLRICNLQMETVYNAYFFIHSKFAPTRGV
ncbi:hypothetical protein [Leptospira noguchii]|uniref:hypothetical protein n=1 Tax=Leptospira noguchii TaxID=28182 RepID=UPI001FB7DE60|nr:hypothetical protein [Leptospira noguchii]UOG31598.1 hypothetical protein MAL06_06205 [Leptospira noguchii]UOG46153.1 hypothetical protein MAL01_06070 [Leptospira noguchii]